MASRHYSVHDLSLSVITVLENIGFELFADLASFKNPEILSNVPRPDIVVKTVINSLLQNYHAAMKRIL